MADEKNERSEKGEERRSRGRAFLEQFLMSLDGEDPAGEEEEALAPEPAEEEAAETDVPDLPEPEPPPAEEPFTEPEPPPAEPSYEEELLAEPEPPPAEPEPPPAEPEPPPAEPLPGEDEPDLISDEELARLLALEPTALLPTAEELTSPEPTAEEEALAVIYGDELTPPDEGTKVFRSETAPEEPPAEEEPPEEPPPEEGEEEPPAEEGEEEAAEEELPEEEYDEEDEYEARDYRPFRRRRNYRTGCMGGLMYFAMIACISVVLAACVWLAANDVLSLNKKEVSAEITIAEDFTIDQVARQLKDAGIINYPFLFKFYSGLSHAEEQIEPGTYTLSSKLDYRAIVTDLQEGAVTLSTVEVTIPEGKTVLQTLEMLADKGVCELEELKSCAAKYNFDYDFLEGLKPGDYTRLEGYLFPDTYEFYVGSSPERAIKKFLDNFKAKVTEEMMLTAGQMGMDFDQVLTVASLIEMEAATDAERPVIASVIYNRLNDPDFPYLQIDATVQYALGERKEKLTYEDLETDSPYNTYKYQGLPPGPICNPGLTSIRAALGPDETNYYYYALQSDGMHAFFSTKHDFEQFINSSAFGG